MTRIALSRPLSPVRLPKAEPPPKSRTFDLHACVQAVLAMGVFVLMLMSVGCGGGGGGGSATSSATGAGGTPTVADEGEILISLTDAPGDFVAYEVDVVSLTLTRANGDVVQTLPASSRVDFNELTEVTEFLSIATVPAGRYTSAVLSMNFADANILVEAQDGSAQEMVPVDVNGNTIGMLDMQVFLNDSAEVTVTPGRPAAFSLDFDLEASNQVDLDNNLVTVEAVLLASSELEADREHRVRGLLEAVDTQASSFTLTVRPFRLRSGRFGELDVATNEDTAFEIDGAGSLGETGLVALADKLQSQAETPVIAAGALVDGSFVAHTVLAGTSVPWTDADVVVGVVVARSDNLLTLSGAYVERSDGRKFHRGRVQVELSDVTEVSAPGWDNNLLSTQSVSVGQRIAARGSFVEGNFEGDTDTLLVLNAASVTMKINQLVAEVVQEIPLAVVLSTLNGREPTVFDFAGTGASEDLDADPDNYEIDVSDLSAPETGAIVKVRGWVNEFGAAPADYLARTVVDLNLDTRRASLGVAWDGGTTMPFLDIDPAQANVDLSTARFALKLRGLRPGQFEELTSVALIAPGDDEGTYSVRVRSTDSGVGEVHVYDSFSALVDELMTQLDAGRLLHRISASGSYDVDAGELTTHRAGFVFADAAVQ